MKSQIKRQSPLTLLRAIDRVSELETNNYQRTYSNDYYLLVKDPNKDSEFFFGIKDVVVQPSGHVEYQITYAPFNETTAGAGNNSILEKDFNRTFKYWSDLVEEYTTLIIKQSAINDPILAQYEEEEYINFEIIDEEANKRSYPLPVQQFIDQYLSDVVKRLEAYKGAEGVDESRSAQVQQIIDDANGLRATQTQLTQSQVATSLSKFWAKARKMGLDVFTEVRREAFKEGIKFFTKHVLENSDDIITTIKGFLE